MLQGAKIPNIMIFAHIEEPFFCDYNASSGVISWIVGSICVIKSLGIFPTSCSLGGGVGRNLGILVVTFILKPLHFSNMHMWGGEAHPT